MSVLGRNATHRSVRGASRKREILDATLSLLEGGTPYLELTVQRVSATAGVSRPTFYAHFGDRRELLIELMSDALAPMFERLAQEGPTSGSALGPRRIRPFISLTIETFRATAPLFTAAIEASFYDDMIRTRMIDAAEPFISAAETTIAVQQAAGLALPGDPRMMATVLVWAVVDNGYRHLRAGTDSDDDALVSALADVALRTVYGAKPASSSKGRSRIST